MSQRIRGRTTADATRNPPNTPSGAALSPGADLRPHGPAIASVRPSSGEAAVGARAKAARKARRASGGTAPEASQRGGSVAVADGEDLFRPETLVRTLRAVADELERDPLLARRVAANAGFAPKTQSTVPQMRKRELRPERPKPLEEVPHTPEHRPSVARRFRPHLVMGAGPELGVGIPDPFALRQRLGHAGLQAVLSGLRLGTLRAIVREHRLDPTGRLARHHSAERLRLLILDATTSRDS